MPYEFAVPGQPGMVSRSYADRPRKQFYTARAPNRATTTYPQICAALEIADHARDKFQKAVKKLDNVPDAIEGKLPEAQARAWAKDFVDNYGDIYWSAKNEQRINWVDTKPDHGLVYPDDRGE